ncbi:MAG: bi-domain-containing oxidoreductase, partial [Planctomycetes bacterium]|nr:bi-domain-containing oxidoreductase [Planctomycetota bacterium]
APKNLITKIPGSVNFSEAAFTTLGAIALQGIRRAQVTIGEKVAIIGLGLLGQLTNQILKTGGCDTIGIDLIKERISLAQKLGLNKGIVLSQGTPTKEIKDFTDDVGVDAVIICAASSDNEPIKLAIDLARHKGRIIVVGAVKMDIPRTGFYEKELDLKISCSYGPGRYDVQYEEKGIDYPIGYVRWTESRNMQAFLNFVAAKKIDLKPLISAEYPLAEAVAAYKNLKNPKKNPLAILLKYKKPVQLSEQKIIIKSIPRIKGTINVAVIGAGNFAKAYHLPNLKKIPDYHLTAVVTATGHKAKDIARQFKADCFTTDYQAILNDKNVDLVLISTRHNLHASIALEAIKKNKSVFLEKPLALTRKECIEIQKALEVNAVSFTVGFNRRYSPLTVQAKSLLDKKSGPLVINYRINAPRLPLNSWVYDPREGGGRIIGECCHFFDLFNYLIRSNLADIAVQQIQPNSTSMLAEDNFSAILKYHDGSIANLIYTTLGHESLPKERVEIFKGGNSILINDFKEMTAFGFNETKNIKLKKADKGHYNQLIEFVKTINGTKATTLTFKDALKAMEPCFIITEKLKRTS